MCLLGCVIVFFILQQVLKLGGTFAIDKDAVLFAYEEVGTSCAGESGGEWAGDRVVVLLV